MEATKALTKKDCMVIVSLMNTGNIYNVVSRSCVLVVVIVDVARARDYESRDCLLFGNGSDYVTSKRILFYYFSIIIIMKIMKLRKIVQ